VRLVFDPAADVRATRIAMGPVNHAAARVPLVLAVDAHAVTAAQRFDPAGQVDVMRHQHGLSARQFHDEPLVA
jgi:hypothetical protein